MLSIICMELVEAELEKIIRKKTGLLIDPCLSGTKIKWLLDHVDGTRVKAEQADLLFGAIDSWIIYKLFGNRVHVTDYSNASRTFLFNIHELKWDDELLKIFNIPRTVLLRTFKLDIYRVPLFFK